MPKRNFLHKKRFFCIKELLNVTFYACKRSFKIRYQYHTCSEHQSTARIVLKKVHGQKKIFCIKGIFLHKKEFFNIKGLPKVTLLCVQEVIQLQVPMSHAKGKLVNYGNCFEKGSCPKKKLGHSKRDFFCIKGLPNVSLLCVQEVIQLQVPISHAKGKLVNYRHCFEKGSCPKENFLHKKGFFCIKGLPNVTFYACKMSFNCRYHITGERKTNQLWALF